MIWIMLQANLIDPCIKGALNVLNSCVKANVKRVVLTSSCSSIRYRDDIQQVCPLNESHWTDLEYCKRYNVVILSYLILYVSLKIMINFMKNVELTKYEFFFLI